MALNLNASPYYDDFSQDKKFHRILFKPGVAVQARELTQLQTILQDQFSKGFGFLLQEGAVVTGCAETIQRVSYIKIQDTDASSAAITDTALKAYVGMDVQGGTTGLRATITAVETGTVAGAPNMKTLYLVYNTSSVTSTKTYFQASETLTLIPTDGTTTGYGYALYNGDTLVVNSTAGYYGTTNRVILQPGVIYARGAFIKTTKISCLVDKYYGMKAKNVGFLISEAVKQSSTDTSLLDPAQGSFNYNAPGADRLEYTVTLAAYDDTAVKPENFYTYANWTGGEIQRINLKDNPLSGVGKILAGRTYDESGNYLVKGNTVSIREHLNSGTNGGLYTAANSGTNKALVIGIDPGISYVGGFKRELSSTKRIPIYKSLAFETEQSRTLSTAYGNYISVNHTHGVFDVDGGTVVDLYNAVQNGAASAAGTKVGSAKARHICWTSGTAGATAAVYRIYLYDVKMSSGDFTAVRGLRSETANPGIANAVLVSSKAVLNETKVNKLVYKLPYKNIKTLEADAGSLDYTYTYMKEYDVTLDTSGGNVTITTSGTETFPYSGSLTDSQIVTNFIVVSKDGFGQNSATIAAGDYIDLTSTNSNASVTVNSSTSITIDLGGAITVGSGSADVRVYVNTQIANAQPIAKALQVDKYIKLDTGTHINTTSGEYNLGVCDGYKITSITHGSNSNYTTGQVDVTDQFRFITGQQDNYFGQAKIFKHSTSTINLSTNRYIVVKMSFFTDTVSTATFSSVDSYPVDDTASPAAGTIRTENIPLYRSNKYGDIDLRDSIDFRPKTINTAATSATLAGATVNPDASETINRPGSGLTNPVPTGTFTTDLQYYIGKNIRVVLDFDGNFRVVEGANSNTPKLPPEPAQSMTLANIKLPPYPCVSPQLAKTVSRPDYGVVVKQAANKRFTMQDIGGLESRIKNLEYYASLNLLETYAKDQTIINASGTDRFKNGILVDPFTGHNVGAVLDPDYHISVDGKAKHARPFFVTQNVETMVHSGVAKATTNAVSTLARTGNSLTLPYSQRVYIQQNKASQFENLAKELQFNYFGDITLNPNVDNYVDTAIRPAVNVNFDGNYDAWENMADAWGTQWGDWEDTGVANVTATTQALDTFSTGGGDGSSSLFTTTTTQQTQVRQGIALDISASTETQNLGEKVVDTAIAPFMRSKMVVVQARRLKPNTRVYPFFDGENVSANCALGTGNQVLMTDAAGVVAVNFLIPQGVFRTGARVFKLTDSATNNDKISVTSATAIYESAGLTQTKQDTIVAMKTANVNSSQFTDDRVTTDVSLGVSIGAGSPLPPAPAPIIINNPPIVTIIDNTVTETVFVEVPAPAPINIPPVVVTTFTNVATFTESITFTEIISPPTFTAPPETFTAPVLSFTAPIPDPPITFTPIVFGWPIIDWPIFIPDPVPVPPTPPVIEDFEFDFGEDFMWGEGFGWNMGMLGDPLAQTFSVNGMSGGVFVTEIDLFFKGRPTSGNDGVTVQIREVINGVPGPKVVPGGERYLDRTSINVSSETGGETTFNPTTFAFRDLVYLQNDTEYCFVPKPENDNLDYTMWISELGENQYGTSERITKQPHAGMMFSSANDRTWSPEQSKDMMFNVKVADFKTDTKVTGYVRNARVDWITPKVGTYVPTTMVQLTPGDMVVGFTPAITVAGTGYTGLTPTVTVTNTGTNGTGLAITATVTGDVISALTVTNPGSGYLTTPTITISAGSSTQATGTVTLNSGVVTGWNSLHKYAEVSWRKGQFLANMLIGSPRGYTSIEKFTDKKVNDIALNASVLMPGPDTQCITSIALTKTGAASNAEQAPVYEPLTFNSTLNLLNEKTIYSYSNEITTYASKGSAMLKLIMSTPQRNVSPMIPLDMLDMLLVANDVNNVTTGEDGRNGGSAKSKYISRRVILEDGMDAEDLNVYLDASIPSEGSIKVYAKLMNAADEGDFQEDLSWLELSAVTAPYERQDGFAEYLYTLPVKSSGTYGLNSGEFEYDLKTVSAIAVTAAGSGYSSVPTVSITGGSGFGATAKANLNGGTTVSSITITNPGRGYTSAPTITISGGGGTGATATASTATVTHSGFKTYAVKVVPLSTNTAQVPKFKDLRAIALQA